MHFQSEPPAAPTRGIDWEGIKAEMVAHEGQWGLIAEDVASSTLTQLRRGKGRFKGEELAHFEFLARRPKGAEKPYGPNRTDVWGRYSA